MKVSFNMNKPLPFPVVKILSQDDATANVFAEPQKWNVVSLWSGGGGKHGKEQPNFEDKALAVSQHRFHDISSPQEGMILCKEDQLREILAFARNKYDQPLLVHCYAGISRSSAVTFCILLDWLKDNSDHPIEDALQYLIAIKSLHLIMPNKYIVNLGIKIIASDTAQQVEWMRTLYNHPIYYKFY